MGEFELIRRYFEHRFVDQSVVLGVGDDCALLQMPPDTQLAVSIDTLVEGTHFLAGTPSDRLAERVLGSAVSDLAAMGATPLWFTLALTLPEASEPWLAPFAQRLAERADEFGIRLVGGDTTRGPLALSVQVHGWVHPGQALTRKGAKPGDLICVTGTLGDSRAGLETLLNSTALNDDVRFLQNRFYCPEPRIASGLQLAGKASSCLDISDGLIGDLKHLLGTELGAELQLDNLPLSDALVASFSQQKAVEWALTGGEDFELCFTLPPEYESLIGSLDSRATIVGEVTSESGINLMLDSRQVSFDGQAFDHFSGQK